MTYALVATYTPDAAAGVVTDFTPPVPGLPAYLSHFPYLPVPYSGYNFMP